MHTKKAPAQAVKTRKETPLLDKRFDDWTEKEREGFMLAFFGRAESLKPMMMR